MIMLRKNEKLFFAIHLFVSLAVCIFLYDLLGKYVYRISFAYFYSSGYEQIFKLWTLLSCIVCIVLTFISAEKLRLCKYLFAPVMGIALYKLIDNVVTLAIFDTRQESFDVVASMAYLLSCYVLLNSLKAINGLVAK
jgi:hypothetical protein